MTSMCAIAGAAILADGSRFATHFRRTVDVEFADGECSWMSKGSVATNLISEQRLTFYVALPRNGHRFVSTNARF